MEQDYTLLLYGKSSTGKSSSLRTLDMASTVIINCEKKPLAFKHKGLNKHVKPETIQDVKIAVKNAIEDDTVKTIVLDSITMLTDIMVYTELVKQAEDSRGGWLELRDWVIGLIEYCKRSNKTFIFIALEMEVLNEREFITDNRPKVVGSLKDSLSSHFTTVLRSVVREVDDEIEYQFQTNKTKEDFHNATKSPMGLFKPYIENDMAKVLGRMEEYYNED